jgi:hypothetical protein
MLTFAKARSRPRVFQQLTGLSLSQFEHLLPDFQAAYQAERDRHAQGQPSRQRRPGGGRRATLATPADKLLFVLFYFRHYPTQEVLAFLFGFSQGQACDWIHRLTPLVQQALGHGLHLPARAAADLVQVLAACPDLTFLIDGTERPTRRPQDRQRQKDDYSGKKKRHTKKNIVVTDKATGQVLGLGQTQPGSTHDTKCVDAEGYTYPQGSKLYKDTGFQGYEPDGVQTYQPKKKPRGGSLTEAEKLVNQQISRQRISVEHSLGGVKVFRIVHDVFRNVKEGLVDTVMEIACGLFNLRLAGRALA